MKTASAAMHRRDAEYTEASDFRDLRASAANFFRRGLPRLAAVCWLAAAALTAVAADESEGGGGLGLTAKIGTLGYGADVTFGPGEHWNVRVGCNQFDYTVSEDSSHGNAVGELHWQTFPVLLDVHPFRGGFRISGGPVINNNRVDLSADADRAVILEGTDYAVTHFDGSMTFDTLSWYLGFGYGNAISRDGRWHFACDFGVMYHGEPEIEATATASDPALQDAMEAALERELQEWNDEASQYRYYPVISFGVSFRF